MAWEQAPDIPEAESVRHGYVCQRNMSTEGLFPIACEG